MRNFLAASGKTVFAAAFALILSVGVFGQSTLNNAVDTDNDGRADYMIFRPSDGVWYISKSGGGFTFQAFGIPGEDFMTPGDYDGDSKGDISVYRDTTGIWYRLNSSNNTFRADAWGLQGDEPVARDYDGDGKTDLAVVRRTNGVMVWYVFRSSDSGYVAYQFGFSTDYVAPGDYDGDGKFDFAVLREGSTPDAALAWYILKSTDGGLLAYSWGATGSDLNAQGDYDGDGKTDIAVWRNTDGKFYVFRSSTQTSSVAAWGLPNDFPVLSYDSH